MAYQPAPVNAWLAYTATPLGPGESWSTGWIDYNGYEGFTIARFADQDSAAGGDSIQTAVGPGTTILPSTGGSYLATDMTKVSAFAVTRGTHIRYTFTNGPVAQTVCFIGIRANSGSTSPQMHTVFQNTLAAMTAALNKSILSIPDSPTVGGVFALITRTLNSLNVHVTNLPATQPVSGSVSVSNLPATQPVSGTVDVGNFPATQPVSGSVAITGTPNVAVTSAPVTQVIPQPLVTANVWSGPVAFAANKHMFTLYNNGAGVIRVHELIARNLQTANVNGVAVQLNVTRFAVAPTGGVAATITANDTNDTITGLAATSGATIAALGNIQNSYATTNDEVGSTTASAGAAVQAMLSMTPDIWEAKPLTLRPGQGVTIQNVTNTTLGSFGFRAVVTIE